MLDTSLRFKIIRGRWDLHNVSPPNCPLQKGVQTHNIKTHLYPLLPIVYNAAKDILHDMPLERQSVHPLCTHQFGAECVVPHILSCRLSARLPRACLGPVVLKCVSRQALGRHCRRAHRVVHLREKVGQRIQHLHRDRDLMQGVLQHLRRHDPPILYSTYVRNGK